jgi:hypothetical protein
VSAKTVCGEYIADTEKRTIGHEMSLHARR